MYTYVYDVMSVQNLAKFLQRDPTASTPKERLKGAVQTVVSTNRMQLYTHQVTDAGVSILTWSA